MDDKGSRDELHAANGTFRVGFENRLKGQGVVVFMIGKAVIAFDRGDVGDVSEAHHANSEPGRGLRCPRRQAPGVIHSCREELSVGIEGLVAPCAEGKMQVVAAHRSDRRAFVCISSSGSTVRKVILLACNDLNNQKSAFLSLQWVGRSTICVIQAPAGPLRCAVGNDTAGLRPPIG